MKFPMEVIYHHNLIHHNFTFPQQNRLPQDVIDDPGKRHQLIKVRRHSAVLLTDAGDEWDTSLCFIYDLDGVNMGDRLERFYDEKWRAARARRMSKIADLGHVDWSDGSLAAQVMVKVQSKNKYPILDERAKLKVFVYCKLCGTCEVNVQWELVLRGDCPVLVTMGGEPVTERVINMDWVLQSALDLFKKFTR